MAERNEKSKALETALSQIEKSFGKGAIMRLGENAGLNVGVDACHLCQVDLPC